jgi:hypothetical protein
MMLGEESASADYWKKCGDEALANGIKGVVMMVRLSNDGLQMLTYDRSTGCALGGWW